MKNLTKTIITVGMILGLQSAYAAQLTIPNTFTANSPAVAADVNTNFTAAKAAVDDNDARIIALDARIAALEAVTDTNNTVLTLVKAAGNWAFILSAAYQGVGVGTEVDTGTMTLLPDGTFTLTTGPGGSSLDVVPGGVGTSNNATTLFTGSGTLAVVSGNKISVDLQFNGGTHLLMTGHVSQNGQVIVLQGTPTPATMENETIVMVKIN